MIWLNESEVESLVTQSRRGYLDNQPNLKQAIGILDRLIEWTNSHSDGWPYWKKPARAASRLMTAVYAGKHPSTHDVDMTDATLKAAITPIKAFMTRQKLSKEEQAWILEG